MSKLVFICTVCLLTIVSKCNSLSNSDIKEILDVLRSNKGDSTSSDSSDEDSVEPSGTRYLRSQDVLALIKKFNNKNQNNRVQNNNQYPLPNPEKRKEYEPDVLNDLLAFSNDKKESPQVDGLKQNIIYQLIKNDPLEEQQQSLQSLNPNRLLVPVSLKNEDERGQMDGLNEYSKIFVVLDPLAVQRNENKNDLKSLLSKILSASSTTIAKSRHEQNKGQFYKGFRLKDNLFARRYDKESYGGNDMSDEGSKRRPKNDYGGGAGGTGGRTAIPYVKLRGDIYERDH